MRRAFAILLLFLSWTVSVHAATRVQSRLCAGNDFASEQDCTFNTNTASTTLLVVVCSVFLGTFTTNNPVISDTKGNTWTLAVNVGDTVEVLSRLYIAYAQNATAGADTVICDPPNASDLTTLVIIEYSGLTTSGALDQVSSVYDDSGATDATAGPTGTTVQANEILVGALVPDATVPNSVSEVPPLTLVEEYEPDGAFMPVAVGDRQLSATGTYSVAWTLANPSLWSAAVLTFKATTGEVARRRIRSVWP
jgi:hypothetical protein